MNRYCLKRVFILAFFFFLSVSVVTVATDQSLQSSVSAPELIQNQLLTMTIQSSPLSTLASVCGDYQVSNFNNVCIKPSYIEGCETYETSSTCHKCSNGYFLNSNKICDFDSLYTGATGASNHILGCIQQSSQDSNNICEKCGSGFYIKQNKCQIGVKNCAQYNNDGVCTNCQHEYSLILSQCRHNSLLGCKYQTDQHTCSECYSPFQLDGQHCDIQNCRILNDYGCVACQCGYYLNAQRTCKSISSGCLRYQRGICKDCLSHYKLKGGVCQIQGCLEYSGNYCKTCSDKYELFEGQCHFKNCLDWLNDSCLICKDKFAIKDGICISVTPLSCQ